MGEIEKVGYLESQNLSIKNNSRNTGIKKSRIGLVKISPFRMKKFEINKSIQYETFFQQSVFKMSLFDIIKAKMSFKHCLTPKNLVAVSFNTQKYHLSIVYY